MTYVFSNVFDWVEFMDSLKIAESGLKDIVAEGRFTNGNKSGIALVYNLNYPSLGFDKDIKVNCEIAKRLPESHPDFERLSGLIGSVFPYSVVAPPFKEPEFLELKLRGNPRILQDFWRDIGIRANNEDYRLQRFHLELGDGYSWCHLLINAEHEAEVRSRPIFTEDRLASVKARYPYKIVRDE